MNNPQDRLARIEESLEKAVDRGEITAKEAYAEMRGAYEEEIDRFHEEIGYW